MTRSIHVRPAVTDDLGAVLPLLAQLHPDEPDMPTVVDARATWDRMLEDPGRSTLVAEQDGEIRATADLVIVPNLTHRARPWAIVENVVVDESYRRRRFGRVVLAAVLDHARAAGCYKVQLLSANGRETHEFYETLGFEARAQGFRLYL